MDIHELIESGNYTPSGIIAELKKKTIVVPDWNALVKEYDTRFHAVMDKKNYPDLTDRKTGVAVPVSRITYALQKVATKRISQLLFSIPVKRIYHAENDAEKEAGKIIEAIFEKARIDAVNLSRSRQFYAACECATLWTAQPVATNYAGHLSPLKLRVRTFSPMDGAGLFPYFNEYDDLVALSLEYTRMEDGDNAVNYFDTYTDAMHYRWRGNGSAWELIESQPHQLGKIPAVYMNRPEPIWEDQSHNVAEVEWTMSRNGNYIRKNARPTWVEFCDEPIRHGGEPLTASADRNVLRYPSNAKAGYQTWTQAIESIKYHVAEIVRNFYAQLQLPDISFDTMKSTPMSGESRKMLFIDAQMKAAEECGAWLEALDREFNVIRAFAKAAFEGDAELVAAFDSLRVEHVITPYQIRDDAEQIQNATAATGGKAVMSQRTAIQRLDFVNDVDEELARIAEEAANDAGDLFGLGDYNPTPANNGEISDETDAVDDNAGVIDKPE